MPLELVDGAFQKKVPYTPTAATAAGSLVLFGNVAAITSVDLAADEEGAVNWPNAGARYKMPNTDGLAALAGSDANYDAANDKFVASGGVKVGTVTDAQASGDTESYIFFIHEK